MGGSHAGTSPQSIPRDSGAPERHRRASGEPPESLRRAAGEPPRNWRKVTACDPVGGSMGSQASQFS
eukprot:10020348-Alexandrium_andersonii.AAC.1